MCYHISLFRCLQDHYIVTCFFSKTMKLSVWWDTDINQCGERSPKQIFVFEVCNFRAEFFWRISGLDPNGNVIGSCAILWQYVSCYRMEFLYYLVQLLKMVSITIIMTDICHQIFAFLTFSGIFWPQDKKIHRE